MYLLLLYLYIVWLVFILCGAVVIMYVYYSCLLFFCLVYKMMFLVAAISCM